MDRFKGRRKGLLKRVYPYRSRSSSSMEEKLSSDGPFRNPLKRIKYDISEMPIEEIVKHHMYYSDALRKLYSSSSTILSGMEEGKKKKMLYYWDQMHQLGRHLEKSWSSSSTILSGMKGIVVRLQGSEGGRVFEVGEAVACQSEMILKIMKVYPDYTVNIPLSLNVCSHALAMVIAYCEYNVNEYVDDADPKKENEFNLAFTQLLVKDASTFLDVMRVAVSLQMKHLIQKCRNCGSGYTIGQLREASKRAYGNCTEEDPTWKLILQSLF